MPYNINAYPKDWKAIAYKVKSAANWTCQHCGKPCRRLKQSKEDFEQYLRSCASEEMAIAFRLKPQQFTLTTAHIDPDPMNCDPINLLALCSVCHLRMDAKMHAENAKKTREGKRRQAQKSQKVHDAIIFKHSISFLFRQGAIMQRLHSTNISPAKAMLLIQIDGDTLLVTDWEVNQCEYNLTEPGVVFTHELTGTYFSYCKENSCLMDENGNCSDTFEIQLPNWSQDGKPLIVRAWLEN